MLRVMLRVMVANILLRVVLVRLSCSHRGLPSRNLTVELDLRDRWSLLFAIFSPTSSLAYTCALIR